MVQTRKQDEIVFGTMENMETPPINDNYEASLSTNPMESANPGNDQISG